MTSRPRPAPRVGLFVGGKGLRMKGAAKGLLAHPEGGTLLDRWVAMFNQLSVPWTLVGAHPAYAREHPVLADDPPGIGPLGGLRALCLGSRDGSVVALACDMPWVTPALLSKLLDEPSGRALAPRRGDRWEPLFARYDVESALPVIDARIALGAHSLQGLCDALGALELGLESPAELDDWDSPEDLNAEAPR